MAHRMHHWLAASAVLLAVPSTAIAQKVTRLAPITPWHVQWAKTSCTLARGFGEKDDPQVLFFEQFSQDQGFQLLITSKGLRGIVQGAKTTLIYGTGEGEAGYVDKPDYPLIGINKKNVPTLFIAGSNLLGSTVGPVRMVEASVTLLHVKYRSKTITFETGPLNKPFDAMRKCTDDLVRSWGLDPDKMKRLVSWPIPKTSPGLWLKSANYPSSALGAGKQALISFRLLIDETGMPTDCLIQKSYNDAAFDKITCAKMLQRARFTPARDEHGQPTNSYYANRAKWIIPF